MTIKLSDIDLLSVGNTIQIVGGLYAGDGKLFLVFFPEDQLHPVSRVKALFRTPQSGFGEVLQEMEVLEMDRADWEKFLRQTDLLETEVWERASDGTLAKAIFRKGQRMIEQGISWAVYRRDGYRCRYCGADDVPLTVDHVLLWEDGGPSIEGNLLTACRKCNRTRGRMPYAEWLRSGYYRNASKGVTAEVRAGNEGMVAKVATMPRVKHVRQR